MNNEFGRRKLFVGFELERRIKFVCLPPKRTGVRAGGSEEKMKSAAEIFILHGGKLFADLNIDFSSLLLRFVEALKSDEGRKTKNIN